MNAGFQTFMAIHCSFKNDSLLQAMPHLSHYFTLLASRILVMP